MKTLAVSLATEGDLDEQVLRQLIQQSGRQIFAGVCYGRRGRDHLKQNIARFNQAARVQPFIVLADLERDECAPLLLQEWLPHGLHRNLILRIAVRAIESWLLADREAFAKFFGVSAATLPHNPDDVTNPKAQVIQLARRSRFRQIREDIAPPSKHQPCGKKLCGTTQPFRLGALATQARGEELAKSGQSDSRDPRVFSIVELQGKTKNASQTKIKIHCQSPTLHPHHRRQAQRQAHEHSDRGTARFCRGRREETQDGGVRARSVA